MKVTAILKGMIDSNGHQPIQIRIADGTRRQFMPTKIKIDPKLWDAPKKRIKPAHPKASQHNKTLEALIIQYQAQAAEGAVKKMPNLSFKEYADRSIEQWELSRKDGTMRQLRSQRDKVLDFAPSLMLSQVTTEWLYSYMAHRKGKGNNSNTIWTAFKFLKQLLHKAESEGLLKENPFKKFKDMPKYRDPVKVWLTVEEIEKIDAYLLEPTISPELFFIGTWFLIACYTGLRLSDLKAFSKKNIVGQRLILSTVKTAEVVSLPINDRLKSYFERIEYKPLHYTGEAYNRLLKVLATGAKISKNITSHTARHSAAMRLANAGVSIEVTAKILGQRNIATTAIYYRISNQRIDDELNKLD